MRFLTVFHFRRTPTSFFQMPQVVWRAYMYFYCTKLRWSPFSITGFDLSQRTQRRWHWTVGFIYISAFSRVVDLTFMELATYTLGYCGAATPASWFQRYTQQQLLKSSAPTQTLSIWYPLPPPPRHCCCVSVGAFDRHARVN